MSSPPGRWATRRDRQSASGARDGRLARHARAGFDLAQRFARPDFRPQFAARRKTAIGWERTSQSAGVSRACARCISPRISASRSATWTRGAGHRDGGFAHPFVAFYPAGAPENSRTVSVGILEFPCPEPGVNDPQRFSVRGHDIGGMQIQAALSLVTEWPQSLDGLAIEVKFGGVLQTQDHGMLAHSVDGAVHVRCQDVFPPEILLLLAGLIEKAVDRLRFGPARTGARDTRRGFVGKIARDLDQSIGQTTVSKFCSAKFFCSPLVHAHRPTQRAHTIQHPAQMAAREIENACAIIAPLQSRNRRNMLNELCVKVWVVGRKKFGALLFMA